MKGTGFIWSPLLPSGVMSKGLMHAVDWLPTLLHAATGKDRTLGFKHSYFIIIHFIVKLNVFLLTSASNPYRWPGHVE